MLFSAAFNKFIYYYLFIHSSLYLYYNFCVPLCYEIWWFSSCVNHDKIFSFLLIIFMCFDIYSTSIYWRPAACSHMSHLAVGIWYYNQIFFKLKLCSCLHLLGFWCYGLLSVWLLRFAELLVPCMFSVPSILFSIFWQSFIMSRAKESYASSSGQLHYDLFYSTSFYSCVISIFNICSH